MYFYSLLGRVTNKSKRNTNRNKERRAAATTSAPAPRGGEESEDDAELQDATDYELRVVSRYQRVAELLRCD